jgi:hypothetical protein
MTFKFLRLHHSSRNINSVKKIFSPIEYKDGIQTQNRKKMELGISHKSVIIRKQNVTMTAK